jgi:hypothetical protein
MTKLIVAFRNFLNAPEYGNYRNYFLGIRKKQVFGYVFELDGKFWWNVMM